MERSAQSRAVRSASAASEGVGDGDEKKEGLWIKGVDEKEEDSASSD